MSYLSDIVKNSGNKYAVVADDGIEESDITPEVVDQYLDEIESITVIGYKP